MSERGTVRLHPRDVTVRQAELDIREEIAATLNKLNIPWVDILYHTAMIKAVLLGEMGATVGPSFYVGEIPDNHHVISTAFYRHMVDYDLTSAELYMIISEWELREAWGMIKAERNGDTEE